MKKAAKVVVSGRKSAAVLAKNAKVKVARGRRQATTAEFIAKAEKVHGKKFDYSRVNYKGTNETIKVGLPGVGYFDVTPTQHLNTKMGGTAIPGGRLKLKESNHVKAMKTNRLPVRLR